LKLHGISIADDEIVESCYEKATEFIPERWGEKPEMVRDKSVFAPFSIGEFPTSDLLPHLRR
jgi:hypothetical protein